MIIMENTAKLWRRKCEASFGWYKRARNAQTSIIHRIQYCHTVKYYWCSICYILMSFPWIEVNISIINTCLCLRLMGYSTSAIKLVMEEHAKIRSTDSRLLSWTMLVVHGREHNGVGMYWLGKSNPKQDLKCFKKFLQII